MTDSQISRRSPFKATSVTSLATGAVGRRAARSTNGSPKVVVVGAGAFGGWAAVHLLRRGAEVTLVDAWGPGNSRSSSGGESRLIRSMYGSDRIYVEMVRRSFELFAELEKETGTRLYYESGSLWMFSGDDAYARESVPIVEDLGFVVEQPSLDEVSKRWPQVDFSGVGTLYFEPRAGVLAARQICRVVRDHFVASGGAYEMAEVVPEIARDGFLSGVRRSDGSRFDADAYVFCCGPWLGRVFPNVIGETVRPSRQEVFYFGPPAGSTDWDRGKFPAWIDSGDRVFYGFPRTFGRGLKFADDTRGEDFDPTDGDRTPSAESLERAREFVARRFPRLAGAPLVEARVCQYENSPDGNLIIDRHPAAENCWIVGGGSGHGFKLGPAVGEMVARRIIDRTELEPKFRLLRWSELEETSTQFN